MAKKVSNFTRYLVLFLVLMMGLTFLPTIQANAGTSVDLIGDSSMASSKTVKYGVSFSQTGYLCYLLTADGNKVAGTSAYAFKCPGFCTIGAGGSPIFKASSRKGGYVVNSWKGVAPWNCSPFNSDKSTNAEAIRNWMKEEAGKVSKGQQFVKDMWGEDCEKKWATGDYILVVETIMHFRYSFDYTYNKSYSETDWAELIYARSEGMPWSTAEMAGRQYYNMAQSGETYRAPFCNPFIGTVRDCLDYYSVAKAYASSSNTFISIKDSNLFSTYLNNVACYAERIGSGSAGEKAGFMPWGGSAGTKLSNAQVKNYGVAMLVISAKDDDIVSPTTPVTPVTPEDHAYDGTIYTLTAAGGSYSSGSGSSATTDFGNGSGSCLSGTFYAENCASGTDAYNLADSMKSGMSYSGSVPPVVFSGTSYDLSVESSLGIVAGMLTVDSSSFPYVDISSSSASDYSSYLNTIKDGLYPTINRCYDGGRKGTGTYDDGSMDCSEIIGGVSNSKTYDVGVYLTLTKDNSSPSSVITWKNGTQLSNGGSMNYLEQDISKVYLNNRSANTSYGRRILHNTKMWEAYVASTEEYIRQLQQNGTLRRVWEDSLENAIVNAENAASNRAYSAYKASNPEPAVSRPWGLTDAEWFASEEYLKWKELHDAWQSAVDDVKREAKAKARREFNQDTYTCYFNTVNGYGSSALGRHTWSFKLYWCTPIMQKTYAVDDKIPIDDGPARGKVLFDEAWKVTFRYNMENLSDLSSVMEHLIVYLPAIGVEEVVAGRVTSVGYYVRDGRIPNTDFLLPDATSMDMR